MLDGWHRYRAAHETGRGDKLTAHATYALGINCDVDPLEYVLQRNADRRQMTTWQRARAAALMAGHAGCTAATGDQRVHS